MKLNAEKMVERFIRYATFDTQSDASNSACPSTDGQRVFAAHLAEELNDIGLADVMIDENGYITATLEATPGKKRGRSLALFPISTPAPTLPAHR